MSVDEIQGSGRPCVDGEVEDEVLGESEVLKREIRLAGEGRVDLQAACERHRGCNAGLDGV